MRYTFLGTLTFLLVFAAPVHADPQSPAAGQGAPDHKSEPRPADPLQSLLAQAAQALEEKDYAAAAQALETYVASRPNDPAAHFQLGYAYTGLERWENARAEYEKAAALEPKMAAAHLNLGLILLERDPTAAVEPLRRAADLLPDQPRPRYLLGRAFERIGNLSAATEHYREASQLAPKDVTFRFALGRALLASKHPAEAETEFQAALRLSPDSAPARLGLAESLVAQQKLERAAREMSAYLELQPGDRESRVELASVYFDLEKYDQALAELDRAEAAASTPAGAKLRAEIYIRQKRFSEAAEALRRSLESRPQDAELHARLGRVWLEKRDFPAAERELQAALRLDPGRSDALRDLSSAYFLDEKYPETLAVLDLLAKRETPGAGAWFIRALCYDKLRKKSEALAAYQRFLELDQGRSADQDFQARQRVRILTRELRK